MKYVRLLWTNLKRKKLRTTLTLLSVTSAFLLYGLLSAVGNAFTGGIDLAGVDRLMVMNKVSYIQPLPLRYFERLASIEGVRQASHATYLEAYYQEPTNYVVAFAVDAQTYLPLYREITIADADKDTWLKNRNGAAVGRVLAQRFGWKVGDRITLKSSMPSAAGAGDAWEFTVDAIFDVAPGAGDTGALLMHYAYLNEGRLYDKDTVWSYAVGVNDPDQAGLVAKRIDQVFENSAAETKTWTEKAMVKNLVAQFGNIGAMVLVIATTVFFTVLLVTASTMSEAVRERSSELALFKAIGFTHAQVSGLILAESMLLMTLGGVAGLALAYLVNGGLAVALAQYMPLYAMRSSDLVIGFVLMVLFGFVAGWLPAQAGFRLPIARTLKAE